MLVLLPILLGVVMVRWSGKLDELLIVKVNGDLTIAHQYLGRLLENSGERIAALAKSAAFGDVLANAGDANAGDLDAFLAGQRDELGLDYLFLTDGETSPGGKFSPLRWPVIESALNGALMSAVDILSPEELAALSPVLVRRAEILLVPTKAAVPTDRSVEARGMIIHSAAPVWLPDGRIAALVGGVLLNRNLHFIDTINALVYRSRSLPAGSQGTATLFLDDVRISTNVRLFESIRALGTRVSAAVRARVLDEGSVWLNRAFVVNDWYISAYEPVIDSRGKRGGMLYVGFLETPFREAKFRSVLTVSIVFLLIAALSVPIFLRWAGHIFLPLEKMTQTIARVEAGDLDARNNQKNRDNEISRVAGHLDVLLDRIQEHDRQLRDWAGQLNEKVEERTRDLQETNRQLEQTTQKLIMSEKLATVGEITASVAHEINNPIAVIQGNLEVARGILGLQTDRVKTEFRLIDDQVYRINSIVSKLLQFARPAEYSGAANSLSPSEVVSDCLVLTRHQIESSGIEVMADFGDECQILMERTELQQVIVNLIVNAVHAMTSGGRLSLRVCRRDNGVDIVVEDTGTGIREETLKRIFDPFYTTKQAQGTGLGLSISQTLISRAGGSIAVESTPGTGSRFTIWLPEAEEM